MFGEDGVDSLYIKDMLTKLMYSQDKKSGAFYGEILEEPIEVEQAPEEEVKPQEVHMEKETSEKIRVEQKNCDYSEDSFVELWKSFATDVREKNASLSRTMLKYLPQKQNNSYVVLVVNQLQQKEIVDDKVEIIAFLRDKLSNDFVNFSVEVSQKEDNDEKFYTSEEKLNKMLNENPTFSKLYSQMDLDLD